MNRRDDWNERLAKVFNSYSGVVGKYGTSDCCCLVRDSIASMTGVNILAGFAMRYRSATGAYRELVKYAGVKTPTELMDKVLGQRIFIALASRGDVVSFKVNEETSKTPVRFRIGELDSLGICLGRKSIFITLNLGLRQVETLSCAAAWRV